MIRFGLGVMGAFILVLTLSSVARADFIVTGTFSSSQEVPPNPSPATGTFSGILNDPMTVLTFTINYSGLIGGIVTGAHFHSPAPPGVNAPVVRGYCSPGPFCADFTSPSGTFTGTWTSLDAMPLTPALAAALLAGNVYFNIHTQVFPGGEIRAQLAARQVPEPASLSLLLLGTTGLMLMRSRKRLMKSAQ